MENLDLTAIADLLQTAMATFTDLYAQLEEAGIIEKLAELTDSIIPLLTNVLGSLGA